MQGLRSLLNAISNTNAHFVSFTYSIWREALILLIFCELMSQFFQVGNGQGFSDTAQITAIMGELTVGLLKFVTLTMLTPLRYNEVINSSFERQPFWPYAMKHTPAFALESLRMLGWTLVWMLALILPGLFKYLRYTFVPYVVLTDPGYEKGEVDALDRSNKLLAGVTFWLVVVLLLLGGVEYLHTYVRKMTNSMPYYSGLLFATFAVSSIVAVYGNLLLYEFYRVRVIELKNREA